MIFIVNKDKMRLCKDNRWRSFANFGTESGCVKLYRSEGMAKFQATKWKGIAVVLPKGHGMDAAGQIQTVSEDGDFYGPHLPMESFFVH